MSLLYLIPARGGSKRLPGKNLRPMCGRPLIAWTILAAQGLPIRETARIVVVTEDDAIASVAATYGVVVLRRPAHMAQDHTSVYHTINWATTIYGRAHKVCLLQPTSPLRLASDIKACVAAAGGDIPGMPAALTFAKGADAPNGAVYVGDAIWLREGGCFDDPGLARVDMPPERSIDVNTLEEFEAAERLMIARLAA